MSAGVCPVCGHRKERGRATCGRPRCWEITTWGTLAGQPAKPCECSYTVGDNPDCPAHRDAFKVLG